ncbi:MAG: sulfur carrier protein ThiS [Desulfobulbaceae bacterium]|nr:sulfur carrier protein ThiS [Desulfobulbaceae bacterium]
MQISINGERRQIDVEELTISALLAMEKVEAPEMVAVQVDGHIIDRRVFQQTKIGAGAEVDFLYFMGGGGGSW